MKNIISVLVICLIATTILSQAAKKPAAKKPAAKKAAPKVSGSCPMATVYGHGATATKIAKFTGKKYCKGIKNSCCTEAEMKDFNTKQWKAMKDANAKKAAKTVLLHADSIALLNSKMTDEKKLGMNRDKKTGTLSCVAAKPAKKKILRILQKITKKSDNQKCIDSEKKWSAANKANETAKKSKDAKVKKAGQDALTKAAAEWKTIVDSVTKKSAASKDAKVKAAVKKCSDAYTKATASAKPAKKPTTPTKKPATKPGKKPVTPAPKKPDTGKTGTKCVKMEATVKKVTAQQKKMRDNKKKYRAAVHTCTKTMTQLTARQYCLSCDADQALYENKNKLIVPKKISKDWLRTVFHL